VDNPSDKIQLNERKWDQRSRTYDQKRFDYFRWMQQQAIRLIDLRPGMHFLDIGCGTGWAVRYVAGLLHDEGDFSGVDISSGMIEKAQSQSQGLEPVHFCQANVERLPFEDETVDAALCTNSFHHYPDPVKALIEIGRVLKPGGRFFILDVTADDFFIRWVDSRVRQNEQEHVKFYGSREYHDLFTAARFDHIQSKTITYPLKIHIAGKPASPQPL